MPKRTCRDCGTNEAQAPYYRCADCLPPSHISACEDCGEVVVRARGATGPLPKRCPPCKHRHRARLSAESKKRGLQDPARMEKERERRRKQMANWRAANPERRKELDRLAKRRAAADPVRSERTRRGSKISRLKRRFDLTTEEAERFLAEAEHGCRICGKEATGRLLHADHCHTTNMLRGWLCNGCNLGLGMFGDNPTSLRAAAEYLEAVTPPPPKRRRSR